MPVKLKDFTPRLYQQTIFASCAKQNTLVVLPTGLGKTALAMMLAVQGLNTHKDKKILLLAPTKPLCQQHLNSLKKHLDLGTLALDAISLDKKKPKTINIIDDRIALFTGSVKPQKRATLWKTASIIISTPQGLENDLINGRIDLKQLSTLIFDEAHHATGDYSYVWLAKQFQKLNANGKILALTASPGSEMDKIKEVCQNLSIEKIELRTDSDYDVKPYIQKTEKQYIELKFPARYKVLHSILKKTIQKKLEAIKLLGFLKKTNLTKKQLLMLQRDLQRKMHRGKMSSVGSSTPNFEVMKAISILAEAIKLEHCLGLLECQGITPLQTYISNLMQQASNGKVKAVKRLAIDPDFKAARHICEKLVAENLIHPKIEMLQTLLHEQLSKDKSSKILVFTELRDSAIEISASLNKLNISNQVFVGQAKTRGIGLSQKQQKEMISEFSNSKFNVLVATSVAEEGLDIPKVDQVIFFEPTPSAIRTIQRRGRTGRNRVGDVKILLTKGTRDEAYRWAAFHKEKRMYRFLEQLKRDSSILLSHNNPQQQLLNKSQPQLTKNSPLPKPNSQSKNSLSQSNPLSANQDKLTSHINSSKAKKQNAPKKIAPIIICDQREKSNLIVKQLIELGALVKIEQLQIADYLLGGQVAVELKKSHDFIQSIIDGRLLKQAKLLRDNYKKPVLIIEGEQDIYALRNIHPNAIRGAIASITLGFGIPIIQTKNEADTAAMLLQMSKREQQSTSTQTSLHQQKPTSLSHSQSYIVSSFPGLGNKIATDLLLHFKSIKSIVNASKEELMVVPGVGERIAKNILKALNTEYKK